MLELIPSLTDVVQKAVQARGGLLLVPAQLGRTLGQPTFRSSSFMPKPGTLAQPRRRRLLRLSSIRLCLSKATC